MERKTRSGKIVSSSPSVEPKVAAPGKRGRKKKNEVTENAAEQTIQQDQTTQHPTRRSMRGKNVSHSDISLNESTASTQIQEEENSNISAISITINDDDNKSINEEKSSLENVTSEIMMKTLEIKLVDCCLQEKESVHEIAMDIDNQLKNKETVKEEEVKEEKIIVLNETIIDEQINEIITINENIKQESVVKHDEDKPINELIDIAKLEKIDIAKETLTSDKNEATVSEETLVCSKIKEENAIVEIKQDIQESYEEVSFLRRSRRLKSIYSEIPPQIQETSVSNIKDQVNMSPDAAIKIKNITKKSHEIEDEKLSNDDIKLIDPKSEHAEIKNENLNEKQIPYEKSLTLEDLQCDPRLSQFVTIKDNIYIKSSDKVICKVNKTMKCDCTITEEDLKNGEMGCRYNCINRLLFIECSSKCRCGEFCDNQQFQRYNYAPVSVFRTEKKGYGIRAEDDIPAETFIIEYVGEVLNNKQFEKRAKKYSKDKNRHYYFMALRSNAVIDATSKGNISRFINHSCDPNAMTQKWTVNGELRVGFFSIRDINRGEEITFDYQFQRYGKEAQKCFCESEKCRGWIGENPMSDEEVEVDDAKPKKSRGKKTAPRKTKVFMEITEADDDDDEENDKIENDIDENISPEKSEMKKEPASEKIIRKTKKRQDIEDLEIEEEINDLTKTGLKNRAHTIRLSRLVVRAKSTDTRSRILKILISGDMPCRRLFLDYNGLRLLHNWMCDISVKSSIPDLYLCMEVMNALNILPITNKTVLRESKVLERVEKWKNLDLEKKKLTKEEKKQAKAEKKKNKAANKLQLDESNKSMDEATLLVRTFDVLEELPMMKLIVKETASELLEKWEVLKEDFKIPKKQKQEIMIEHEREAGMEEWQANNTTDSANNERYKNRFGEDSFTSSNNRNISSSYKKTFDPMERQKRRQMFAMRMAQEEMEKRMNLLHENNCALFGLSPTLTHPLNVPFRVNRVTGQYCNILGAILPIPPNHHNFKYEPLTLSTNPDDYNLPPIDLPEHWKYAIDKYGRIYYYHEKIRQPQWEAPIKILPLNVNSDSDDPNEIDSDESETETEDSEEEELRELLEMLKKKKQLMTSQSTTNTTQMDTDEDDLEKKIMNNMLSNPPDQAIKLSQLPVKKCLKKKSRRGLSTMKFIRPRTEEDKLYGRTETRRYKELKEKLRRDKKRRMLLGESSGNISEDDDEEEDGDATLDESSLVKMVDELDILTKSKQLDKIRKIKKDVAESPTLDHSKLKKGKTTLTSLDQAQIKRQFRDEIKEEIMKFLQPYREETCVNGKITSQEDFISLVNKLTFSVLTKESKHCAQSNSILKATDSVKGKTKEYIKKYMAKFEGSYLRKSDEQDYANILNRM
ncbi:hypothetical protein PVAND_011596 [Polypedilum vanderplanki]|uniref:[histone H3]-lysine(36) N-trimethyltransferase n=1 Tax=Polypedilum vanderplanki TaxID=319348 RepID=A0A9J6CK38_POLVA|nr:hypothetical protein PVAND_011596 [Polypedilum vanderplanki]